MPDEQQLRDFAFDTLNSGRVIPGYGHAVLRVVDPRFTCLHEFGEKYLPEDPLFQTADRVFKVVPKVLGEYSDERVKAGKHPIANVWPNVDAISGALVHHFSVTEYSYYTVLFAVSRIMGLLSQLVMARALLLPITRPKSMSTAYIRKAVENQK